MSTDRHKMDSAIRSILKIEEYTKDHNYDSFSNSPITVDACLMQFVNLGERLTNISNNLKTKLSHLPISNVRQLRNAIAHSYDSIKNDIIWNTIKTEIPKLKAELQTIIESLNAE